MGEVASVERVPASLLPRRPLPAVDVPACVGMAAKGAEKPSENDPGPVLSGGQQGLAAPAVRPLR